MAKKKEDYEKRVKELEARIKELEEKRKREKEEEEERKGEKEVEEKPSIVESVVGQFIPGLSGLVRTLEKSSPEFRKRIAETDAKIKHRLETGWTSTPGAGGRSFARPMKPKVEYGVTIRELVPEKKEFRPEIEKRREEVIKPPEVVREPIIDIFETEKYISVIAELPGVEEKEIEINLSGDELEISAGKYKKNIKLPCVAKAIAERTYKHGILELKLEKK